MKKNNKNTKFLTKTFISEPLNSIAFNGNQKHAELYVKEKEIIFVNYKSSTGHHSKSYDYENNNKYMQKPKNHYKSARSKCRSH